MMNFSSAIRVNKGGVCAILTLLFIVLVLYYHTGKSEVRSNDQELISLKELLSASIDAAKRGGNEVRRVREDATLHMKSKGKTKEGVNDPVTDGDMKSHIQMYYSLDKAFPGLEIISEEHDTSSSAHLISGVAPAYIRDPEVEKLVIMDKIVYVGDVKVWIDPLDATKEYTEDLRQYVTTMVGISVRGVPTIGVIHRPFSNETHWGWLDHGMSPDLMAIKKKMTSSSLSNPNALTSPRIIVSISHQGKVMDVAKEAFGDKVTVIPAAGAGYKIMEVINDRADLYVHTSLIKKWDLLAGHAILRAVGGVLSSLTDSSESSMTYGDKTKYRVEHGLLATIHNHKTYFTKLQNLVNNG